MATKGPLIMNPAFAVPLTQLELLTLGYITLVWGQIDFLLDEILMFAHEFDAEQRKQFLTDKPIGGKLDMLVKNISRLDPEIQGTATAFADLLRATKQQRNSACHGVWGWKWEKRSKTRQVAVRHSTTINNPVHATQLRGLADQLTEASLLGSQLMCGLRELGYEPAIQFTWGGGVDANTPPTWLEQSGGQSRKGRMPRDRRTQGPSTPPKAERD